MQIDDIESKKLLPNWAHDADWIQAAFDQIVQIGVGRLPAIDAPLTMQAIQCLTDDELREWYARFGVVEYYPDLNRETREKMLYWIARLYRFLGTPHAIRVLCDYIYNDLPLDVTVIDNLAFDGETLVDPALLDLFDVEIDAGSSGISPANAYRLVSNIMRIARNSQTLRKIIYDYASDIDAPCAPCAYGSAVSVMVSDNDELARVVPPPGPTLPTVSMSGDFGTDNLCRLGTSVQNIDSGKTKILYDSQGNYIYFDATKLFAVVWWQEQQGIVAGRTEFSLVRYGGPWTGLKNDTQSTLRVLYVKLAVCSSNLATVITVYDTSNVDYNAFKFTTNGTDYYYVLDGTQTDWTDDLSSIGYHLPVVLPTVEKRSNIYANSTGRNAQIVSGSEEFVYEYVDGSYRGILYDDTTIKQCIYGWLYYTSGMSAWERHYYGVSAVNISGNSLGVRNDTQNTINVTYLLYATCSDSTATVITVYNSSNVAYNAFKFTEDNTDYYYVLDGTQADWTDDLSSIGYRLPIIGYFSSSGESATGSTSLSKNYWHPLFKADGTYMEGDQSKTYTPTIAVKASGGLLDVSNGYMQCVLYTGLLNIQFKPASSILARYLTFIES